MEQVREKKSTFTEIFSKATFILHKWNSNEQELEVKETQKSEDNLSFAKQQLGVTSRTAERSCGARSKKSLGALMTSHMNDVIYAMTSHVSIVAAITNNWQ